MTKDGANKAKDLPSTSQQNISEPRVRLSTKEVADEGVYSLLHLLEEKEKDLELAAKIGNSLLEQNKELQERNEFLEESLMASNENLVQLKYQLKQRSSLFYAIADLEEDEKRSSQSIGDTTHGRSQELEKRLKSMEHENRNLKGEASKLEDYAANLERRERDRVKEYLGQLEKANLKIGRLQEQILEKNKECAAQAEEAEKLVKEINQRKQKEKALAATNDDLTIQLNGAISNHETLKADIADLQERYFEVMGMLQQTEEELKGYRQRADLYRTSSADSLYDSLASELEASDSGCYNTPNFSARCESQQSSSQRRSGNSVELQADFHLSGLDSLDRDNSFASIEESNKETDLYEQDGEAGPCSIFDEAQLLSYDVPTRALVNAVRSARGRNLSESTRNMEKNLSDTDAFDCASNEQSEHQPSKKSLAERNRTECHKTDDLQTPVAESMSFSTISFRSSISAKTMIPSADFSGLEGQNLDSTFTIPCLENGQDAGSFGEQTRNAKSYRDMATSPIELESPVQRRHSKFSASAPMKTIRSKSSPKASSPRVSPAEIVCCPSSSSSSSSETIPKLVKSNSSDSLASYNGPKMGEPGRPGTKDLDFGIRRLNLRNEIEQNYQRFRQQKGHQSSSKFYANFVPRSISAYPTGNKQEDVQLPCTSQQFSIPKESYSYSHLFTGHSSPFNHWSRRKLPGVMDETAGGGVMVRNRVENEEFKEIPKSGSCPRLDGIMRKLVKEKQTPLLRPNLSSLFLLRNQRARHPPAGFSQVLTSRGTSPVAHFTFSNSISGLNQMLEQQSASSGILQRFGPFT